MYLLGSDKPKRGDAVHRHRVFVSEVVQDLCVSLTNVFVSEPASILLNGAQISVKQNFIPLLIHSIAIQRPLPTFHCGILFSLGRFTLLFLSSFHRSFPTFGPVYRKTPDRIYFINIVFLFD